MDQDLVEVFDENFYNNYYGCKSNIREYWEYERHNGRFCHPCIIEDNFDYGLFISKLNWANISINTEYSAVNYFLQNRLDFLAWFQHPNISKETVTRLKEPPSICSIYVCYLESYADVEISLKSLTKVFDISQNVYIILLGSPEYSNIIRKQYPDSIKEPSPKLLKLINKHDYCLYTNNKIYIHNDLQYFVTNAILDDQDIVSSNDVYNIAHDNKYYYGINTNFCFIKRKIFKKVFGVIYKNFNNIEYYLNKYIHENKLSYKCLFYNILEKEKFWNNLFTFDILDYMHLIEKYNLPIYSKKKYEINILNLSNCRIENIDNKKPLVDQIKIKTKTKEIENFSNIACHFHIGNTSPSYLQEANYYIKILKKLNIDTYVTSTEILPNIDSYILPNIGADIGPFLYMCAKYLLNNTKYDTILKIHSKTHHGYRHLNFDTLIYNIKYINYIFKHKSSCGIAGCLNNIYKIDEINKDIIANFCHSHRIHYRHNFEFFAGTMFVCKIDMLKKFIQQHNIDLLNEYWSLEVEYIKNTIPTNTHSWERILTGIVPQNTHYSKIYV